MLPTTRCNEATTKLTPHTRLAKQKALTRKVKRGEAKPNYCIARLLHTVNGKHTWGRGRNAPYPFFGHTSECQKWQQISRISKRHEKSTSQQQQQNMT